MEPITPPYKRSNDVREFVASSLLFGGYKLSISLYKVSTIDDIIDLFKESLVSLFHENNLYNLEKKAKELKLHIHSHTIEDILTSNCDDIFYICDHCD